MNVVVAMVFGDRAESFVPRRCTPTQDVRHARSVHGADGGGVAACGACAAHRGTTASAGESAPAIIAVDVNVVNVNTVIYSNSMSGGR